jgi:hypothetical protein
METSSVALGNGSVPATIRQKRTGLAIFGRLSLLSNVTNNITHSLTPPPKFTYSLGLCHKDRNKL